MPPEAGPQAAGGGRGPVLLVEDEEPVRRYMLRALTQLGFSVLLAANGHEALAIFHEHRSELVLVMLDFSLPGLSGDQVLATIQEGSSIPVVVCTGSHEDEVEELVA